MANMYNVGMLGIGDRSIDWVSGTIMCMLLAATPTFDATDATIGAVITTGNTEATVSGYSRQNLAATKEVILVAGATQFKCGNTSFDTLAAGETIYGAIVVLYIDGGNADIPISMHDTNDIPTNGSNVVFNPASGVVSTIVNA